MRKTKFLLTLLVALSMFGFMGCEGGSSPRPGQTDDIDQPGVIENVLQWLFVTERGVAYDSSGNDPNTMDITEVFVNDSVANVKTYQMAGISDVPLPNGMLVFQTDNSTGTSNPGANDIAVEPISRRAAVGTRARTNQANLFSILNVRDIQLSPADVGPVQAMLADPAGVNNEDFFGAQDFVATEFHPGGSFVLMAGAPAGNNPGFLNCYAYNAAVGNITQVASVPTGVQPREIAITPNGQFIYVANLGGNSVSGYSIDPGTGFLAPTPGSPYATGGVGTFGVTVERNGAFLYATSSVSGDITGFAIGADGSLAQISLGGGNPPGPVTLFNSPFGIDANSQADALYVADRANRQVFAFRVDPATGVITQAGPPGFIGGDQFNATGVAVDPTGRFVVSSNTAGGDETLFGNLYPMTMSNADTFGGGLTLFRIQPDASLTREQTIDGLANPYGMDFLQVTL